MTHIGGLLDKMTGSVLLTAKEVKEVEDHIDQLKAENAMLRELGKQYELVIVDYRAEVAKLRELVRDAWGSGHPDKSCGDCEIMDECHAEIEEAHKKGNGLWNTRCLFERRIEDRMRELGVEVDDGKA